MRYENFFNEFRICKSPQKKIAVDWLSTVSNKSNFKSDFTDFQWIVRNKLLNCRSGSA